MASLAVTNIVAAQLAASGWAYAPVIDNNLGQDAPAGNTPFLTITYPVGTERQISFGAPGSNTFREEGAIRFVLSVPSKKGTAAYLPWMDALRAAFRSLVIGEFVTWAAPPVTIDDRNDNGAYFNLSVSIPYRFDTLA